MNNIIFGIIFAEIICIGICSLILVFTKQDCCLDFICSCKQSILPTNSNPPVANAIEFSMPSISPPQMLISRTIEQASVAMEEGRVYNSALTPQ